MRIAIVTDAWAPQVNGVVRTLQETVRGLRALDHEVSVISPDLFRSTPCPTYPEIRLALTTRKRVAAMLDGFAPHAVHIATEGPLGLHARKHCIVRNQPFTTAYHTQFPQYVARRTHLPAEWFWRFITWFHRPSCGIMVATESVKRELAEHGLAKLRDWSRGVDLAAFGADVPPPDAYAGLERPIQLYVGRVAVEKNIEAFLATTQPGSKVVVGDGPALARLRSAHPDVHFLGRQSGIALAGCYAGADVFVFPSRTDTFGLVMIEALACGTPVAAYPVTGPVDVIDDTCGAMDDDLNRAIEKALSRDPQACIAKARHYSWEASVAQFVAALECDEPPAALH